MSNLSETSKKPDRDHRMLRLGLGLTLLGCGLFHKKPSNFLQALSTGIGAAFVVYGVTGWDPLAAMSNKDVLSEKKNAVKGFFESWRTSKSLNPVQNEAHENKNDDNQTEEKANH